nr:hypothetical protein [Nitratireductor basaltis]
MRRRWLLLASALVLLGAFAWGYYLDRFTSLAAPFIDPRFNIKGNISASGERIYHLPGQEYYTRTRVNWLRGERHFCSEVEARRAGFRRSRV